MTGAPFSVEQHKALEKSLRRLRGGDLASAERALGVALGRGKAASFSDEAANLAAMAEDRTSALDWPMALLLYEVLVAAGHRSHEWIRSRLAWRTAHQQAFVEQFLVPSSFERLGEFLGAQTPRRVTAIRTEPMRPGFIGMALFKHHVTYEGEEAEAVLVEKVMSEEQRDMRRARQEHLLFSAMPPAALMAPAYHGMLRQGHFVSTFQAFFDGRPLAIERWIPTHAELLYRYWSIVPAARLARGPMLAPLYLDQVRRLVEKDLPAEVKGHLRRLSVDNVALSLSRRFTAISEAIAAMPVFIFHDDLHCGNILVSDSGEMTIIDWDNWVLAPLGTGWRFYSTEETVDEMQLDRIRWARELAPSIGQRELMLMAALWGWHKALRDSKHELAARWLEKLVHYA